MVVVWAYLSAPETMSSHFQGPLAPRDEHSLADAGFLSSAVVKGPSKSKEPESKDIAKLKELKSKLKLKVKGT